jgi:hypothetical protein
MRHFTAAARRALAGVIGILVAHWAQADTAVSPTPMPEVSVIAPRPPTPEELAGEAVHDFVRAHARPTVVTGQLARWEIAVCPIAQGLPPAFNAFVSARILAVAASVGAPHQAGDKCRDRHNVYIFFTSEPQKLLAEVMKQDERLLGFHYPQTKNLGTTTRAIQGWYVTATRGVKGDQSIDEAEPLLPLQSSLLNMGKHPAGLPGSRLTSHLSSGIVNVLIVADMSKIVGREIGQISDYLAMLALTQAFAAEQCGSLPSIMDLMAPDCGERDKPSGITAGDLAFLRALYHTDLEAVLPAEQDHILDNMMHQFKELTARQ